MQKASFRGFGFVSPCPISTTIFITPHCLVLYDIVLASPMTILESSRIPPSLSGQVSVGLAMNS